VILKLDVSNTHDVCFKIRINYSRKFIQLLDTKFRIIMLRGVIVAIITQLCSSFKINAFTYRTYCATWAIFLGEGFVTCSHHLHRPSDRSSVSSALVFVTVPFSTISLCANRCDAFVKIRRKSMLYESSLLNAILAVVAKIILDIVSSVKTCERLPLPVATWFVSPVFPSSVPDVVRVRGSSTPLIVSINRAYFCSRSRLRIFILFLNIAFIVNIAHRQASLLHGPSGKI